MLKEFEQIVGKQMFAAFVKMLTTIGADARTQRISVVVAAMLKYALDQLPGECEHSSVGAALLLLAGEPYLAHERSDETERLYGLIDALCKKAGMQNERQASSGSCYSIAEHAVIEFTNWYAMPWEDYV